MLEAASLPIGDHPSMVPAVALPTMPTIARVRSFASLEAATEAWASLEAQAALSPYQTRAWLWPWVSTIGAARGIAPAIIVAYNDREEPIALLPFGSRRAGRVVIGSFLGGRDSNFNMGLFKPGLCWDRATLLDILRRGARAASPPIDLFMLVNQPLVWEDRPNPLALLPRQPSPSYAFKARLDCEGRSFLKARLSREARRKLRQKTTWLNRVGKLAHHVALTREARIEALDAYFAQRKARDLVLGLPAYDSAGLRRFLETLFLDEGTAAPGQTSDGAEIHTLSCGTRIVATFIAAVHRNRCCGMLISFASDPDLARMSPGDVLLSAVIEDQGRRGRAVFDLGIGEARYKQTYCPDIEILFDTILPLSNGGRLHALATRLLLRAKRAIKQSAFVWHLVRRLRKWRRASWSRNPFKMMSPKSSFEWIGRCIKGETGAAPHSK